MAGEAQLQPMQHWSLTIDKFIDHAATGKIDKKVLRDRLAAGGVAALEAL